MINFKMQILFAIITFFFFILENSVCALENKRPIIQMENVPENLQKEIDLRFPDLKGSKELNLSVIDDVLRFIHGKINYDLVVFMQRGNEYVIKILNSTRISKIQITGVNSVSTGKLKELLGASENDILDTNLILDGAEKMRKFYVESGYFNAQVNIEIPEVSPNKVEIHLNVEEGLPTKVNEISIISPNETLNKKLLSRVSKYNHRIYTENVTNEIQKNIKEYFKENFLIQAEIDTPEKTVNDAETEINLIFKLKHIQKYSFEFEGYKEITALRLEKVLDLENYISSNPNVASEMTQKIKNFYLSKGYARVEVKTHEYEVNNYENKVIFKIQEGPRVQIDKVIFNGSISKDNKYYENLFKTLSPELLADGYYNKNLVDEVITQFKLELQNQGFLLVNVINVRTVYNSSKDKVTVFIQMDEGPLTIVENLFFEGNKNISSEKLMEIINIKTGQPLELFKLEKSLSKIKSYYQENGYLEVSILNEKENLVSYNISNTKANLLYSIDEGPRVKVSSIVTEGNTLTKDKIIFLELEFKQGDILTPAKIEESIARLQKTGYFNTIDIRTLEQRTSISDRTVIVKVTERDPGLFTTGFGATNERRGTLRGYTGVAYRNIFGTGRGVSARLEGKYNIADIKYPELKVIFGYVEPHLFDTRLRGRINISRSRYISDLDNTKATESNQYIYAVEKDLTSHVTGIFELYNLEQIRDFLIATNESTQNLNIASLGPTIDLDFRDNPFVPTQGVYARWNLEYASPFLGSTPTIEYYRTTGSVTHYLPVGEKMVLAHQVRLGYLENLNKLENGGVPYSKKGFILGGRSTIRGFEIGTQEVLPNNTDLGIKSDTDVYYLTTTATEFLFKSELRFPLVGSFYGGVFYDGGAVYIKDLPFRDNYRDSVGMGLRYLTPVGAFNMEVGKKLDRREGEDEYRYHLSFGTF